eukprot:9493534-Pyramimonas_sp.AAC.1
MTTDSGGKAGGPAHLEVSASVASLRVTTSRATLKGRPPRDLHLITFPSRSSPRGLHFDVSTSGFSPISRCFPCGKCDPIGTIRGRAVPFLP